ncbi:MAG: 4Fe-4S dicluster domain-containing protein [Candidatus Tectomicrobia bacterium]|uniref:4Fe-4S dicluster domain-containing protein n=1 Tax=Tectimicrobiota bacterium TaxID=2528274 RepID=A0A932CMX9_UNCTE|nr:4Fe-4S dicluster domain-containing protein [Candidatus Tectomicrobia bacterium]
MPQIVIDHTACNGCGSCVEGCPMDVFALEGNKAQVSSIEDCMACKYCETLCPDKLIRVED